jgi:nicotinate-nucleotide adenylyltransferase
LFDLANIAVAARPGSRLLQPDAMPGDLKNAASPRLVADASAAGAAGSVLLQHMTPLDISASAIRDTLARHGSARYLLPDAVLDYIHEHQLYVHI